MAPQCGNGGEGPGVGEKHAGGGVLWANGSVGASGGRGAGAELPQVAYVWI